jgi:uncharacterized protein
MTRQHVVEKVRSRFGELQAMGVRSISLFGSVARGQSTEESDVDFLVELDPSTGLFGFFRIQHFLEEVCGGSKVDLLMPSALHPALRDDILAEAVRVA